MMRRKLLLLGMLATAGCSSQPAVDDGLSESAYISDQGVYAQPKPRGLSAQEAATDKNVIGCVKIEYLIGLDGSAREVRILESVPAGYFDAKVLRAMEQIRFRPRSALGLGKRTFSFAPSQAREVLASAAALCENVAPTPLPPPPEGSLLDDPRYSPTDASPDSSTGSKTPPRRPTGRR